MSCNAGNSSLSSLVLDSSRGLLYFTDTGSGTVGVLSTDGFGGSPHLLIVGANDKPKAIAVDFTNRQTKYLLIHIYLVVQLQIFLDKSSWLIPLY